MYSKTERKDRYYLIEVFHQSDCTRDQEHWFKGSGYYYTCGCVMCKDIKSPYGPFETYFEAEYDFRANNVGLKLN